MKTTDTFMNQETKRVFKIRHQLNCKSKHFIYLLECIICNNKAYVGKCETSGHLRINNHRSDAKRTGSIAVDAHFAQTNHDFDKHARFTFIEKITKTDLTPVEMTDLLHRREDFWIIKLGTIENGFNDKLNLTYTPLQIRAIKNA